MTMRRAEAEAGRSSRRRPRRSDARGQAVVELALAMPMLALMLLAGVEMGRLFVAYLSLTDAARAGVQYGILNNTNTTGMQTIALNDVVGVKSPSATATRFCQCASGASVSCAGTCSVGSVLLYVQVNVTAQFTTLTSYPGIPSPVAMSATAAMRVQ